MFARAHPEALNCNHFCRQNPRDCLTPVVPLVQYVLTTGFTVLKRANGHVWAEWTFAHWRSLASLGIDMPEFPRQYTTRLFFSFSGFQHLVVYTSEWSAFITHTS